MPIEFHHLVDEVMAAHPATIHVFLQYGMRCVGCPIACFHSVEDACVEHRQEPSAFLAALRDAADPRQRHRATRSNPANP